MLFYDGGCTYSLSRPHQGARCEWKESVDKRKRNCVSPEAIFRGMSYPHQLEFSHQKSSYDCNVVMLLLSAIKKHLANQLFYTRRREISMRRLPSIPKRQTTGIDLPQCRSGSLQDTCRRRMELRIVERSRWGSQTVINTFNWEAESTWKARKMFYLNNRINPWTLDIGKLAAV